MVFGLDSLKSMRDMAAERGAGYRKNCSIFVKDKYWLVLFLRAASIAVGQCVMNLETW